MTAKNGSKNKKRISPKTGLPVRKYTKRSPDNVVNEPYQWARGAYVSKSKKRKEQKSVKGAPTTFEYTSPPFDIGDPLARVVDSTHLVLDGLPLFGPGGLMSRSWSNPASVPTPAAIPWSQQLGTLFARVEQLQAEGATSFRETERLNALLVDATAERDELLQSKGMRIAFIPASTSEHE